MVTELHLQLALEAYTNNDDDSYIKELATETLIIYTLQKLGEADEEEIYDYINGLIIDYCLERGVANGDLECEYDEVHGTCYKLTEQGENFVESMNNEI